MMMSVLDNVNAVCYKEACVVNAMIFLSPISNFDVFLPEDPSVNSMVSRLQHYLYASLTESQHHSARFVWAMEADLREQTISASNVHPFPEQDGSTSEETRFRYVW